MKHFLITYKYIFFGILSGVVLGSMLLVAPSIFAATFYGQTCDGTTQWGRVECTGYFEGDKNADNAGTTMYDQPSMTDVEDKAAFIDRFQSFLNGSNTQFQISAAATIDVMLGVNGPTFGNKAAGIQYARDNFNKWAALIDSYDAQGLVDWEYNYAATSPFPNSGYGAAKDDVFFRTSQTDDTILIIRFRNPDGVADDAFFIDKWCGNVKGGGFMEAPVYSISGSVFVDNNRNGVLDAGEPAYTGGATISRSGQSSGSTTTSGSGAYSFANIDSGNYTVSVGVPAGYIATTASSQAVALTADKSGVNFGIAPNYTISGNVFIDTNGNGAKDAGEGNYANATINRSGASSGATNSDANGNYTFGNLNAGNYTLTITVPAGYTINTPSQATTLGPNKSINFGLQPVYTISGNIFNDGNKSKIKDAGEINDPNRPIVTASKGTVTTNANGIYTISNIPQGAVTISYTSLPSGFIMTYPLNGPPPSFQVTVGAGCTVNGALGGTCTGGSITNLNFAVNNNVKPWMQSVCDDMRFDDGINIPVPVGLSAIATNASCTTPGIAFTGDTIAAFSPGTASTTDQIVGGSTYPEVYKSPTSGGIGSSYTYLEQKAQSGGITPSNLASVCTLANCTLPANLPHGIYQANSDVTLNTYNFPANQDYIFLINGTLTIAGNVIVPTSSNSTAIFSVSGNIIVPATVGSPPAIATPNLAAIFSTDRSFVMPSNNNCTDLRLNIAGTLVVNAGRTGGTLQNSRDLCASNTTIPSLQISPRLDFVLNLPDFVKTQSITSRETAP